MFRHLLVPLDGSQLAESVIPVAGFLAGECGAQITLLHVLESGTDGTVHGQRHLAGLEEAEDYLKELAGREFPPGVKAGWHVHETGTTDVARSLAEHAGEFQPDLLVMCAHGEDRWRNRLFGNLAQQTLKIGHLPVLLIQPGRETHPPFQQLLVPLDGLEEHEDSLPAATEVAKLCSAAVLILSVVPTPGSLSGEEAAAGSLLPGATRAMLDLAENEAVGYLEKHIVRLKEAGIESRALVARGDPVEQITEVTITQNTDLVVLSTHGKAGVQAFWSASVASKLISRLAVSFFLVPATPLS